MYFQQFPLLRYTLDNKNSYQVIQDIFRRVVISYASKMNNSYYSLYDVMDGETPEIVSHKFYRTTQHHWIILHANEIIDPRFDWVMSQQNLQEYVSAKYNGDIYGIHHYEWVIYPGTEAEQRLESPTQTGNFQTSISNWEYEDRLNEAKRQIKVITPELVPALDVEFGKLIKT